MGTLRAILVSGVLGLVACPADDGGESTNTSEDTSSATTTGSGSSASGSGMSTSSTTASTDEGTSSSSDGSTTEVATGPLSTTGSSGSSSGTDPPNGGDACDPEAQEHPCLECFVDDCCKSWTMCLADEGCTVRESWAASGGHEQAKSRESCGLLASSGNRSDP